MKEEVKEDVGVGTKKFDGSWVVPTLREKIRAGIPRKMKKKKDMIERHK